MSLNGEGTRPAERGRSVKMVRPKDDESNTVGVAAKASPMGAETAEIRTRESGWGKPLQEKRQRKVWCACPVVVNVHGLAGQGAWRVVKVAGRGDGNW